MTLSGVFLFSFGQRRDGRTETRWDRFWVFSDQCRVLALLEHVPFLKDETTKRNGKWDLGLGGVHDGQYTGRQRGAARGPV
jgi:hypothetical protein